MGDADNKERKEGEKKNVSLLGLEDFHPVQNRVNFILMVVAAFPWIFALYQVSQCDADKTYQADSPRLGDKFCHHVLATPLWMLNFLFLWLISIFFWVLSVIQSSTWVCPPPPPPLHSPVTELSLAHSPAGS